MSRFGGFLNRVCNRYLYSLQEVLLYSASVGSFNIEIIARPHSLCYPSSELKVESCHTSGHLAYLFEAPRLSE